MLSISKNISLLKALKKLEMRVVLPKGNLSRIFRNNE